MIRPPTVKVINQGFIAHEGDEIVDASSSVTLVEAAGKRIIVDTGAAKDRNTLLGSFDAIHISPDRIDIVVNTHLHRDHIGCNDLFRKARFYAHRLESPPVGTVALNAGLRLVEGVEIVPTPGHTLGSVSVLVYAERRYAICGDAIPTRANFEKHVPPFINVDSKLALKSMDLLSAWGQTVIPGHDALFVVPGK